MESEAGEKTELAEVLFNLASDDRLTLLSKIDASRQRLRDLSSIINATPQECSRHISRLMDSGLIKKNEDGFYETTTLGRALLDLFPSYEFLLSNRRYFMTHDLRFLPRSFLGRIGELSRGVYVNHFSEVLELIKKVIATGRDHVWLLSDKPMVVGHSIGPTFFSRDIPVKLIGQDIDKMILEETRSSLPHSEIALLPSVKVAIALNEALAGVCFPDAAGKIDFGEGFAGTDSKFLGWCSDLFEHYWSKSEKVFAGGSMPRVNDSV